MTTMNITHFKTHALKIIDKIYQNHETVIITKRGKPVAEIIPYKYSNSKNIPGKLADTLIYEKDIVSPLGEDMWEVCK